MNTLVSDIARRLRYRALTKAIGRTVTIRRLESVRADVVRTLYPIVPAEADLYRSTTQVRGMAITLSKYNLLDLTFTAPGLALEDGDAQGISLLTQLGFVPGESDPDEEELFEDMLEAGLSVLEELDEELKVEETVIRLLLQGEAAAPITPDHPENARLPQRFVVRDACLTNAGSVWAHKHFYL